jgi:hypothetical protein
MNIYDYVIEEESAYKKPINVSEGWDWSMKEHIKRSTLYKNSQFERDNENRDKRPFKNIVRPILNIQYRTEGFDVKDIELYVNNPESYYKSFLVKKFHEKWALNNEMDTFIDEVVESYVDYGGVLVKNVEGAKPEVVDLRTLAFCDQTDILSGPFAIKHNFSPMQLREMAKKGWGDSKKGATIDVETLIAISEKSRKSEADIKNETPGKYIEIYELHGVFPDNFLKREDSEERAYTQQIHIIAFYKDRNGQDIGVTLFSAREPKLPFKFLVRDKIKGRALGFGGVEELFEAQVWTNYSEIQIREMLDLASKTLYKTTDQRFKTRNQLINADNGQIFDLQQGADIAQIDTTPRNLAVFNNALEQWEEHANKIGAASEILQGESPSAGTPFKSLEAQIIEGKGLHRWRQGKIAVFIDEIYRDWVLPYIAKEIVKGQKFLAELSVDELQSIANQIIENMTNNFVKERILNGQLVFPEEMREFREKAMEKFIQGGQNRFIEILKDEFKEEPLDIKTNIAGKQKNLALLTDKVVNVLRQFIATPEIRQDPEMIKLLNTILESSGMSPIIFGVSRPAIKPEGSASTEPLKQLAKTQRETVPAA